MGPLKSPKHRLLTVSPFCLLTGAENTGTSHLEGSRSVVFSPECQIIFFYEGKSCERKITLSFHEAVSHTPPDHSPTLFSRLNVGLCLSFFKFHSQWDRVKAELRGSVFSINVALCARISFIFKKCNLITIKMEMPLLTACFHHTFNLRRWYFPACRLNARWNNNLSVYVNISFLIILIHL